MIQHLGNIGNVIHQTETELADKLQKYLQINLSCSHYHADNICIKWHHTKARYIYIYVTVELSMNLQLHINGIEKND